MQLQHVPEPQIYYTIYESQFKMENQLQVSWSGVGPDHWLYKSLDWRHGARFFHLTLPHLVF